VRIYFFCLFLVFTFNSVAQKVIISGEETKRLLTWKDFTGVADNNSSFFAYTAYTTAVKFDDVQFSGDKAVIKGFIMTLELDAKKSWVKKGKESDDLLKHEQGHFDVGILYMQAVLQKVDSANFTRSGYQQEFQKLIKEIHQKYRDMGSQYDKETNHSIKKDEQEKWNIYFTENVRR
jgi:hypothetical protein